MIPSGGEGMSPSLGKNSRVKLEVFMALINKYMVIWNVTSFNLVDRCQHFRGFIYPEKGGGRCFQYLSAKAHGMTSHKAIIFFIHISIDKQTN
jgi:hypothetical protein